MFKVYCYDAQNRMPIVLQVHSMTTALDYVKLELTTFGNMFKIVRFDIADYFGFICRINARV